MTRIQHRWAPGLGWLVGFGLVMAALPASGQVVVALHELHADGTPGESVTFRDDALALGSGDVQLTILHWARISGGDPRGTVHVRFRVDEHGVVQPPIQIDDGDARLTGLVQAYQLSHAVGAWTFPPGQPRLLEAAIELAKPGAPVASESVSPETLSRWLRRVERWKVPELVEACDPCRIWAAFEQESRTVAASLDNAAELFGPMMRSEHPTLAVIAGWRVAEAEGMSLDGVLLTMAKSEAPCARYVTGRRFLEQGPHLVRGASVADLDDLTAALGAAKVPAAAMRPTSTMPNLAVSSTGNGSDHIVGMAYFEQVDSRWKLLCRGAERLDL